MVTADKLARLDFDFCELENLREKMSADDFWSAMEESRVIRKKNRDKFKSLIAEVRKMKPGNQRGIILSEAISIDSEFKFSCEKR